MSGYTPITGDDHIDTLLLRWFNGEPSEEDITRLQELHTQGGFDSWTCPECGDDVLQGDPEDWSDFQGADQVDFASYPPSEDYVAEKHLQFDTRCDHCRCRMKGEE